MKVFATVTRPYQSACDRWLKSSIEAVEPNASVTIEVLPDITGSPDFQSASFVAHNVEKNRLLVNWIDQNIGELIFITDADIIYFRPFLARLVEEGVSCDCALAIESPNGGFNIGQMVIRCSANTRVFFSDIGDALARGAWDQEAVNRLLPSSGLTVKPLSRFFANDAVWRWLSSADRARAYSYHATGTMPRDGKTSLQLKEECIARATVERLRAL